VLLIAAGCGSGVVSAQENYLFTASLAGGLAGAFDVDNQRDFDHRVFQAGFGMYTNDRTLTTVRAGRISFDSRQAFEGLFDAELDFVNVAGEYRFRQAAYDFGLFVGVGSYWIRGEGGADGDDQTALGAALGFTGDFDVTRRLSLIAELDLHYVFFDDANLYGVALAGLAVHF
jgi:hypothetical protein